MVNKGLLLVVSGPSGVGKDSVLNKLAQMRDNLYHSISATTRKPREEEIDGKDYFFLSEEEFLNHIKNNEMLEYAVYCGNYYGTPQNTVVQKLNDGIDVVLEIEVQGALIVKKRIPEAVMIFILPPSIEDLYDRLKGRNTESEETIRMRIEIAKKEMSYAGSYDYNVINDRIENAAKKISDIISAEKQKTKYYDDFLNSLK